MNPQAAAPQSTTPQNTSLNAQGSSGDAFWYLAASKPRQEIRAVENLLNQNIEAFSPIYKVEKIKRGKRVLVEEPMFTGYVFIKLSPEDGLWHKVKSTRGIRDWIKFGGNIAKVPSDLVEKFKQDELTQTTPVVKKVFKTGDLVSVMSGPLDGLKGIYQASSGDERSMILINFLGNVNRLEIDNVQLRTE